MIGAGGLSDVDSGKNDVQKWRIAETIASDLTFSRSSAIVIFEVFKDLVAECTTLFLALIVLSHIYNLYSIHSSIITDPRSISLFSSLPGWLQQEEPPGGARPIFVFRTQAHCRGLTRTICILLHRASDNVMSQPGIEPGTSCTAGEYSMKKAIRTAVFRCHSGCYSSPPPKSLRGIVAECDSVACRVRMEIRPNACRCVRIAHHAGVTTM